MASFEHYAPLLKKLEGGWVDDPADNGGATMCGVTLATYRKYYGASKTKDDLRRIPDAQWAYIMKQYWDACKAEQITNQSIAEIFVDWNVNSGKTGIKEAQRAIGTDADGIVGKKTLAILNSSNSAIIFNRIKQAREAFYRKLAFQSANKRKFINGWLSRLSKFIYY